ncbi:MAG: OprD family outer membrane porin, partial [Candidatus Eremiobacteraeota bacterium]|nr:OprD family outer membrane porin [Candidatus Eremiobacteraeota bacterium]
IILHAAALMLAAVATASPAPTPAPLATPQGAFTTSGVVRAFEFQRINRVGVNANAFSLGGSLHAEYTTSARPLTLGLTYYFADPVGTGGPNPRTNPNIDNSLPGFPYRSLGELYAQYRTFRDVLQIGKMQLTSPWANAADGRMIPVTFQGITARRYFAPGWDLGVMRVARFKSRTSSAFDANNLLTNATTPGFLLVDLTRTAGSFSGSLHTYWFYDVASLTHAEVRLALSERSFITAQGIEEHEIGRALVGTIHSHVLGLQYGTRIGAVNATLGYNAIPAVSYRTNNPGSIFQPVGGTPNKRALGRGLFEVAGGGIASPYTDGYVADPLFTTSLVASLVDRRSTGSAIKLAFSATSGNGRLTGSIAHGFYDYSNRLGTATATETELDGTYFLSNVDPTRGYTGFSFRQRWSYRASSGPPFAFLYSRSQLQYTF